MSESNHPNCGDPACDCRGPASEDLCDTNSTSDEAGFKLPQDVPLPPPSLMTLATSLTSQAMVSMGIFPHPITGKSEFLFHQAQHLIDTVDLIFKKTEGNRTDEETKMIEQMLHELRMLFIAAQNEKNRRDSENKVESGE